MSKDKFPIELLSKSKDDRYGYFQNLTIAHPILTEVRDLVWNCIRGDESTKILLVFGPTGVGKTTLIRSLQKLITEYAQEEINNNPHHIPEVCIEAQMPIVGNFDWKAYFEDVIEKLNKVAARRIRVSGADLYDSAYKELIALGHNKTTAKVRMAAEKALLWRKLLALLIDEGQHITVVSSARKLLDQQNTLKSIANRSETLHALFGTYDLMLLRDLNGQLSRRTGEIHFRRYDNRNTKDVEFFINICETFQRRIPIEKEPDLVSNCEFLYERSLGCVGILKDWLNRSVRRMFDEGKEILKFEHLERSALSVPKCLTILNEILTAEETLAREAEKGRLETLRSLLKQPSQIIREESTSDQKPRRKREKISRNPKRDPLADEVSDGF